MSQNSPLRLGQVKGDWLDFGKPSQEAALQKEALDRAEVLLNEYVRLADELLVKSTEEELDSVASRFVTAWKDRFLRYL